jgi:hypothetical protein
MAQVKKPSDYWRRHKMGRPRKVLKTSGSVRNEDRSSDCPDIPLRNKNIWSGMEMAVQPVRAKKLFASFFWPPSTEEGK